MKEAFQVGEPVVGNMEIVGWFIVIIASVVTLCCIFLVVKFFAIRDNKRFNSEKLASESEKTEAFEIRFMPPPNMSEINMMHQWMQSNTRIGPAGATVGKTKTKTLDEQLKDALQEEDYMLAAKLRDEINQQIK